MPVRLSEVIIEPKRIYAALADIIRGQEQPEPDKIRAQVLVVMRGAYDRGQQAIHKQFLKTQNSKRAVRQATALIDQLVTILFQFAGNHLYRAKNGHLKEHLALVAVGGYGREELFPYSDIDILFLHDEAEWDEASKIAEFVLYTLWDMGMTVGQSVATLDEIIELAGKDYTARTNVLDARLICGNSLLFSDFQHRFQEEVANESSYLDFVEAKMHEREERHHRCGDSRYVLEPNIKDGKGGLRDIQTLYWLARYVYRIDKTLELVRLGVLRPEEHRAYIRALRFLSKIRIHLHLLAERAEERLTFDMQRAVAERMGYRDRGNMLGVERFMKAYFLNAKTVGNLTHVFCAVLEDERKRKRKNPFVNLVFNPIRLGGFILETGRLAVPHEKFFRENPARIIGLFATAQEHGFDIHPRTLRLVTRQLSLVNADLRANEEANALFVQILTSPKQPEQILRRMSDAGVLGRFIPDFGRVMGQMQYDMYHVYTVDEHTLFAIGILNQIALGQRQEEFPLTSELVCRVPSPRVLYLAVLCHDIAKGRGGDHSMLGEKVAYKLAKRLGFDEQEAQTCGWLVRYHLLFSHTAFKRDISEDKTVEDFVAKVQSPERLRLLLLLTVVDIRAVGPKVWNSWKGALLRELYYRAETKMGLTDARIRAHGQAAIQALKAALPQWRAEDVAAYLSLGNEQFFTSLTPLTHAKVARLIEELESGENKPFALNVEVNDKQAITEVLVVTRDKKGLFALVTGALATIRANIVNAKVFTLKNGLAVEQYMVQGTQGKAFERRDKWDEFNAIITAHMEGRPHVPQLSLPVRRHTRYDVFNVPPRVIIENNVSSYHTVIEVNGRDRPGFLYLITKALAEMELGVSTAHITSYGERAVDVFYVKDKFGMKIESEQKIRQIHAKLIAALTQDSVGPMPEPEEETLSVDSR